MTDRILVLSAVYAVLPDGHFMGYYFGVRYGDGIGNRGSLLSLTIALMVSMLAVIPAFPLAARYPSQWRGSDCMFLRRHGLARVA